MLIWQEVRLECAHVLPKHPGKCRRLHGHSYLLQVAIEGPVDPETGMVIDFGTLKEIVEEHVEEVLDHRFVNEVFVSHNWPGEASAENLSLFIWRQLVDHFTDPYYLIHIKLWETAKYHVQLSRYDLLPEAPPVQEALTEEGEP